MLNFTFDALEQAKAARSRLGNFLGELKDITRESDGIQDIRPLVETARAGFVAGLEDDLNISESLASLFSLVKSIYPLVTQGAISRRQAQLVLEFFFSLDEVLAIKPSPVRSASGKIPGFSSVEGKATAVEEKSADVDGRLESDIQKKIEARQKARAEKDFNHADEIRKELLRQGILLEDTKDGVRWKKIPPPQD
jgi:cysteinyl-tRNA synthetase